MDLGALQWKMKRLLPRPKRHGWIVADMRRRDFHSLPRGLREGTFVEVISVMNEWARVRDPSGNVFEVHSVYQLDMGRNFLINGDWVREDDLRVLDAWEEALARLAATPPRPGPWGRDHHEAVARLEILLARHGRRKPRRPTTGPE